MKKMVSLLLTLVLCLGLCVPALAAETRTEIRVSTVKELRAAIGSDRTVILSSGVYDLREGDESGGGNLFLSKLENLTLAGEGKVELVNADVSEQVVTVYECTNITLENLTMGHGELADYCLAGVLYAYKSDVTVKNCDIYGCGHSGFYALRSTALLEGTTIRDCSANIMDVEGTVVCRGCTFSGNGYLEEESRNFSAISLFSTFSQSTLLLEDCAFLNNKNTSFLSVVSKLPNPVTIRNCTFSGNGWPTSEQALAPESIAYESKQAVSIDGTSIELPAYALKDADGNLTNYVRVRDLASLLNGSAAQFNVGWNGALGAVDLTSRHAYDTPNGTEGTVPFSGDQSYTEFAGATLVDGIKSDLTAFTITYEGGGHTYYKLRDLGRALGFNVGWSAARGIFIETDKPYTDAD